ncbi:MAG: DUF748 domain-containing protein, partial [Deltaproteobacteria bacterium]|nr:DUF748 domain-containing protein [Deltaproteobacteria bacterium]
MRVLLKVLLIVVVVVGLCAAAAVIAIRFLPETDLIRDSLQGTLHELTGHNVLLGALKTSLSLRGPLRLTVEGVSVTSRSGVNLLSADTVELAPSLASLWERKVSIQTIHIHGLRMVVRRDASGRLVDFVPPEAVTTSGQTPSPERAEDRSRTPHQTGTTSKEPSSGGIDTGIRWSVDSIRLVGGQIDWIDQRGSGGQETRISLKNINGSLERKEGGSAVLTRITGELAGSKGQGGTVTLDGSVAPSPDFTSLVGADLNLRATSLDLKIFQEYGPTAASLQQTFDSADLQARVAWQNETTAKVSFSAQIKSGKIQSAMLKLDGDLTVRDDLSGIRDIRCVAKTDMVPLALLNSIVPRDFPLNTEKGSTKGSVKGEWSAPESWRLAGDIEVENVILTGRFRAVADAVQLSIRGELTPQNLILQNLDVTGARKIASVAGVVSNPLSEARELDLKGELALRAEWLKALGLELPKEVHLNGAVPIRGKLRGKVGDLSVDLAGDLSDAAVRWVPYLEK